MEGCTRATFIVWPSGHWEFKFGNDRFYLKLFNTFKVILILFHNKAFYEDVV